MQKQLILPKTYSLHKERPEEKYRKYIGYSKLSYSAINSFMEDGYKGEFFSSYFLGLENKGNIFTSYGTCVGGYISDNIDEHNMLSEFDKSVLRDKIGNPEGSIYEREILIDRGSYVLSGFVDRIIIDKDNNTDVVDFKTGSVNSKKAYYESDKYTQVDTYCYALETEGLTIRDSGVILLDRKGNGSIQHPLRLTGDTLPIPKPYNRQKTEKTLEEFDYVAKDIENFFRVYNKYLK